MSTPLDEAHLFELNLTISAKSAQFEARYDIVCFSSIVFQFIGSLVSIWSRRIEQISGVSFAISDLSLFCTDLPRHRLILLFSASRMLVQIMIPLCFYISLAFYERIIVVIFVSFLRNLYLFPALCYDLTLLYTEHALQNFSINCRSVYAETSSRLRLQGWEVDVID